MYSGVGELYFTLTSIIALTWPVHSIEISFAYSPYRAKPRRIATRASDELENADYAQEKEEQATVASNKRRRIFWDAPLLDVQTVFLRPLVQYSTYRLNKLW